MCGNYLLSSRPGILKIKIHSLEKLELLAKYLGACLRFQQRYHNFCYFDTHSGSGICDFNGERKRGSALIAAKISAETEPPFPCIFMEIDRKRSVNLRRFAEPLGDFVTVLYGDCNQHIKQVLDILPKYKFSLGFIDPDGLAYHGKGFTRHQLLWGTIEKIGKYPRRTELLINFPLEAITRCAGELPNVTHSKRARASVQRVTDFYGTDEWMEIWKRREQDVISAARARIELLDLYIKRLQKPNGFYEHVLQRLVTTSAGSPVYYLVFATNHDKGNKIMSTYMDELKLTKYTYHTLHDFF